MYTLPRGLEPRAAILRGTHFGSDVTRAETDRGPRGSLSADSWGGVCKRTPRRRPGHTVGGPGGVGPTRRAAV